MSMHAPVDDMDGKTPAEVLRELAWMRRQRNDLIVQREAHAKARGEAEHRRSKAERALDDARKSFRGALAALGQPSDRLDHGHLEFCGEGPHGEPCNRIVVNGECPEHGPVGP